MRMALAMLLSIPCWRIFGLVQNKSSPTRSDKVPSFSVNAFHPSQSSSAMPSSMETIGYCLTHDDHSVTISSEDFLDLSDLKKTYLPSSHISLVAGSRQMEISLPG